MLTRDFFETDRIRKLFEARDAENSLSIPEIPRYPTTSAESSLSSIRNVRSIAVQPEHKRASVETQQQHQKKISIKVQPQQQQQQQQQQPKDMNTHSGKDILKITKDVKKERRGSDVSTISLHGRTSPTYL